MANGDATVVHGSIYFGAAANTTDIADMYLVYCYDLSQDNWTTLTLPVRLSSLGQIDGKLVAVGGVKKSDNNITGEVYTYVEKSRKWKQTLPPMPTARANLSVLSLQSALIAVGGDIQHDTATDTVEVLKLDTSQWYKTDQIPRACNSISLVASGNTCYVLGGCSGHDDTIFFKHALHASVSDLLHNAVPANQTTHSGSSDTQSAWKILPNTPTYTPAAAILVGNLLTIGGGDKPVIGGTTMKEVYMYSTATDSWIYISDLPVPRSNTTVAVLSATEILLVGGYNAASGDYVNTVYKGTLQIEP